MPRNASPSLAPRRRRRYSLHCCLTIRHALVWDSRNKKVVRIAHAWIYRLPTAATRHTSPCPDEAIFIIMPDEAGLGGALRDEEGLGRRRTKCG